VVRGGVEPPTFRFSGGFSLPTPFSREHAKAGLTHVPAVQWTSSHDTASPPRSACVRIGCGFLVPAGPFAHPLWAFCGPWATRRHGHRVDVTVVVARAITPMPEKLVLAVRSRGHQPGEDGEPTGRATGGILASGSGGGLAEPRS
jgi:hypothetical protein